MNTLKKIMVGACLLTAALWSFDSHRFGNGLFAQTDSPTEKKDTAADTGNSISSSVTTDADQTNTAAGDVSASGTDQQNTASASGAAAADTAVSSTAADTAGDKKTAAGKAVVPGPRRPLPADQKKSEDAAQKDESPDSVEKNKQTIKFGISDEIAALVEKLTGADDPRYADELYDLFQKTTSSDIREKILAYFAHFKDPCLEDYAVTVVNDPYDLKRSTVTASLDYLAAVKCREALPAVVALIESEKEDYFDNSVMMLGEAGGGPEALYLADMLKKEDLTVTRKQALMRALGKIKAVETWPQLVDIAKNRDENMFVRMYAAEAIGEMKKSESVPVLVSLMEDTDPNLRQYVVKGLVNFPGNKDAENAIVQGIRDDYYKVRIESIKASAEMKAVTAIPYLVYRAENDKENAVKKECYPAIAALNTKEGNDFLISIISDKKKGDTAKQYAASALIKNGSTGEQEVLALADECLKDDRRKQLRYAIGKQMISDVKPSYGAICAGYLSSKDEMTVGIGLSLYRVGKFNAAEAAVRTIAESERTSGNQKTARKLLGLPETPEKTGQAAEKK